MEPNRLSENLRRLATAIENAKQPSRARVATHLQKLIAAMEDKPEEEEEPASEE